MGSPYPSSVQGVRPDSISAWAARCRFISKAEKEPLVRDDGKDVVKVIKEITREGNG